MRSAASSPAPSSSSASGRSGSTWSSCGWPRPTGRSGTCSSARDNAILPYLASAGIILFTPLFFVLAVWVYKIIRPHEKVGEVWERNLAEEALLAEVEAIHHCPTCERRIDDEWIICPTCRTRLNRVCPNCSRLVGLDWSLCAWCGKDFERRPVAAALGAVAGRARRDRANRRSRLTRASGAPPSAIRRRARRAPGCPGRRTGSRGRVRAVTCRALSPGPAGRLRLERGPAVGRSRIRAPRVDDARRGPSRPASPAAPPSGARHGTFTIEGRSAPALFVIGWLATLLGAGFLVVGVLSGGGATSLALIVVGLLLLSVGLVAGAGSQGIERRARGTCSLCRALAVARLRARRSRFRSWRSSSSALPLDAAGMPSTDRGRLALGRRPGPGLRRPDPAAGRRCRGARLAGDGRAPAGSCRAGAR